jgi:predicted hotdog family 3-hydroxylacyl-ACP dehydratase
MTESFPDSVSLLPHTGSMVFIDKVLSRTGSNICCRIIPKATHAPFTPQPDAAVCSSVAIEYMAQATACLGSLMSDVQQAGLLMAVRKLRVETPELTPDKPLLAHAELLGETAASSSFDCRLEREDNQREVASARIAIMKLESYEQ